MVDVNPKRIELTKICSVLIPNGTRKIKEPTSRGPNPPNATGNDAQRKIPGTTNKTRKILIFMPTQKRQIQKLKPKRIWELNEIKIVLLSWLAIHRFFITPLKCFLMKLNLTLVLLENLKIHTNINGKNEIESNSIR